MTLCLTDLIYRFRALSLILTVLVAYAVASSSEDHVFQLRALSLRDGYVLRGISAYYDNGVHSESANSTSRAVFVRVTASGTFALNGSWIAEARKVSQAMSQSMHYELYRTSLLKCHPSLVECANAVSRYDFILLKRTASPPVMILRTWHNLRRDVTGYDAAHGWQVPEMDGTMSYESANTPCSLPFPMPSAQFQSV